MKFQLGVVLAASLVIVAGGCAAGSSGGGGGGGGGAPAPSDVEEGVPPRDNMFTRTAALALSQAMQNADPGERRSRYEEALQAALDGIVNQPNNPQSYRQAGEAYVGLNDFTGADSMWTRAEDLYPLYSFDLNPLREQQWVNQYNQAVNQIQAGQMDAAVPMLEAAHTIYKGRPEAMLNLGSLHAQLGNDDEAVRWYRTSLELLRGPEREAQPEDVQATWSDNEEIAAFNLAQILANSGRNEEAEVAYRTYLERSPDNVTALSNLAVVLMSMDRNDEAAEIYQGLLARTDLDSRDYYVTGIGLYNAENYSMAAQAFGRSYELIPESRDALYNYAQALYLAGELDELYPAAVALAEMDPHNNNVYRLLAQGLMAQGDTAEAARVLEEEMAALPFEIDGTNLQPFGGGGGVVNGELVNHSLAEGGSIEIRVFFYGSDGMEIGTEDVSVPVPAAEMREFFRAEIDTDQDVVAYRYEVIS